MRRLNIPTLASGIAARGHIGAADVQVLRQNFFNGEEIWPHEARALFDLMQKSLPAAPEWEDFFVDAMTHYVVDELEPRGALDEKNSRFLCAMLRRDQINWGRLELALVVAVMERAGSAPVSLQQFVLEMTQQVCLSGTPWVFAPRHDVEKEEAAPAQPVSQIPATREPERAETEQASRAA